MAVAQLLVSESSQAAYAHRALTERGELPLTERVANLKVLA
jgi:hypothetical protein